MMNETDAVEHLKQIIDESRLLEKYHLDRIGIFGSYVRGEAANDVDILVQIESDYPRLIKFRTELESLLHKKVDIVIEKFANPIVLHRAKQDMIYVVKH
jgi:predicted nucleotidyltransferase